MDFNKIKYAVLNVYIRCNVKSFPIDCLDLLDKLNIRHIKYSSLNAKKKAMLHDMTKDSYRIKNTVYYNDDVTELVEGRIRFNLMHELGHIILDHKGETEENENEADEFSASILAPLYMLYIAGVKTQDDIIKAFNVSDACAKNRMASYKAWYDAREYYDPDTDKYYVSLYAAETKMRNYFYSEEYGRVVYSIKQCSEHGEVLINGNECRRCESKRKGFINFGVDKSVVALEYKWCYSDIF